MENWLSFDDPRFAFKFRYPARATDGELVERIENQQAGMLRVHILSPIGREVYFEVSKYDALTAEAEYQRHKEYLLKQFHPLQITALINTPFASLPACRYTFEWDQGERTVILVERGDATYRIIYNPRFPVNLRILSTVEWIDLQ